jgi:hypothetical protein
MTIDLKPDQQRVIDLAIQSGASCVTLASSYNESRTEDC